MDTSSAENFRKSFPVLSNYHYLDSATANLVPVEVTSKISSYLRDNTDLAAGKGMHELFVQTLLFIDKARKVVNRWTGLPGREIVFCNNLAVANEIISRALRLQDHFNELVVLTASHSSFLPYQRDFLAAPKAVHFTDFTSNAAIDYQSLERMPPRNSLVILSPVFLATGEKLDLNKILSCFDPDLNNRFIVDYSLCASYLPLNELLPLDPATILVDAGQGLFLPGIGFIAVKESLLPTGKPFIAGDLAVSTVGKHSIEYEKGWRPYEVPFLEPSKLAGLKHVIENTGAEFIKKNFNNCSKMLKKTSSSLEDLGFTVYGPDLNKRLTSIIGFNLNDISSHDLAMILDECNVQIRSGLLCSHVMMDDTNLSKKNNGICQVSLQYYNTEEDFKALDEGLELIKEQFG